MSDDSEPLIPTRLEFPDPGPDPARFAIDTTGEIQIAPAAHSLNSYRVQVGDNPPYEIPACVDPGCPCRSPWPNATVTIDDYPPCPECDAMPRVAVDVVISSVDENESPCVPPDRS